MGGYGADWVAGRRRGDYEPDDARALFLWSVFPCDGADLYRRDLPQKAGDGHGHTQMPSQVAADDIIKMLTEETKLDVISAIPCYCDIQFTQREFLTALEYPDHPFSSQITSLIAAMDKEN